MCLAINKDEQPKVAEENIIVYKSVRVRDNELLSSYRNYIWKKGLLRVTKMEESDEKLYADWRDKDINYGFHTQLKFIGKGFHSCGSFIRATEIKQWYDEQVMECMIPKGALYYHNLSDLYVSNKIIPLKLLS